MSKVRKGRKDEQLLRRTVPCGVGELTDKKYAALVELRELVAQVSNEMACLVYREEPLAHERRTLTDIDRELAAFQNQYDKGLNKVYVEQVRDAVGTSIYELERRYFRRLSGSLAYCDSKIEDPKGRIYYHVPEEVEDRVTEEDFEELKAIACKGKAIELFQDVILHQKECGLNEVQLAIVRDIHARAKGRHTRPDYARNPQWKAQIKIDYRIVRGYQSQEKMEARKKEINTELARLLKDDRNHLYRDFLELSHPYPRQDPIRIPLIFSKRAFRKYGNDPEAKIRSFMVELGRDRFEVKAVMAKDKPESSIREEDEVLCFSHFAARDWGITNTATLVVIRCPGAIPRKVLDEIMGMKKEDAKHYLELHAFQDEIEKYVVTRKCFCGKRFTRRAEHYLGQIDRLRSQIDPLYEKIHHAAGILKSYYGLPEDAPIDPCWEAKDPLIQRIQKRFFKRLDEVKGLKEKRRRLYRKIDDLKKSWLGFIANEELRLIRDLPGPVAFIREDLDLTTFSKDDPNYRGPEHNRKINHSAKGKLKRKEDDKLTWDGIPVMEFPSYYSSTYCPACGYIHSDSRKGEKFKCVRCRYEAHADENACIVLGLYPFLTLKSSDKLLLPTGAGGTSSPRPEASG